MFYRQRILKNKKQANEEAKLVSATQSGWQATYINQKVRPTIPTIKKKQKTTKIGNENKT